jgi:hypothetical protein
MSRLFLSRHWGWKRLDSSGASMTVVARARGWCGRWGRWLLYFALLECFIFSSAVMLASPWLYHLRVKSMATGILTWLRFTYISELSCHTYKYGDQNSGLAEIYLRFWEIRYH